MPDSQLEPVSIYTELQKAFDLFNQEFFQNLLPKCMFVLGRKGKRLMGYYQPDQWQQGKDEYSIGEIFFNPVFFKQQTTEEILSTLLHEMVHLWQEKYGKPSRNGYHNRKWAFKMIELGLQPSHTGREGGRITGQSMDDYILEDGKFSLIVKDLKMNIKFSKREQLTMKKSSVKTKFSCKKCQQTVWGKPSLNIDCGYCKQPFEAVV